MIGIVRLTWILQAKDEAVESRVPVEPINRKRF
uniref:Uncharacterized protein n=1 Tax=Rhizophora mucronata TaxID=61149 RepID=A0A2P2PFT7_RHIMU